jgi:hypothetical protein
VLIRSQLGDLETNSRLQAVIDVNKCNIPLIKSGMEPPVKNPTQSLVNELQLKSVYGG